MKFEVLFIRAGAHKCSPKFPIPITYSWKKIDRWISNVYWKGIYHQNKQEKICFLYIAYSWYSIQKLCPSWSSQTYQYLVVIYILFFRLVFVKDHMICMNGKCTTAFICNLTKFFILYFINETIYSWSEMFGDFWYILQYWYLGKMKRYWCFSFHTLINISFDYDVFIFIFVI